MGSNPDLSSFSALNKMHIEEIIAISAIDRRSILIANQAETAFETITALKCLSNKCLVFYLNLST